MSERIFVRVPFEVKGELLNGGPGTGDQRSERSADMGEDQDEPVLAADMASLVFDASPQLRVVERQERTCRDDDPRPCQAGRGDVNAGPPDDGAAVRPDPQRLSAKRPLNGARSTGEPPGHRDQ